MRHSHYLFAGLVCCFLSSVLGSYDAGGYGATHVHPHHGHSAGSYYHYHVPLVGQQQHYQPSYHHQDHSHYLWPLLLLLALPLLFLPLLPLLLLPLGISLLALLAPGGMMMMMMMMMMMGGGMMMRTDTISGRAFNEMRTFGDVILMDMTSLLSKYARSFDLDQCPQRVACEMGAILYPENNSSDTSTAKAFTSLIMEQYLPKGKIKKTIRLFEKAFWTGSSKAGSCSSLFQCHPTFKIYGSGGGSGGKEHEVKGTGGPAKSGSSSSSSTSTSTSSHFNGSRVEATNFRTKQVNFVYPSSTKAKVNDAIDSGNAINNYLSLEEDGAKKQTSNIKTKRSHYSNSNHLHEFDASNYGKHKLEGIHIPSSGMLYNNRKTTLYKMFGTPTVKS